MPGNAYFASRCGCVSVLMRSVRNRGLSTGSVDVVGGPCAPPSPLRTPPLSPQVRPGRAGDAGGGRADTLPRAGADLEHGRAPALRQEVGHGAAAAAETLTRAGENRSERRKTHLNE